MQSYKRGIIKHPHSEGKSGKVYIGDTLKAAIDEYNEKNPQNSMPPIACSGKTYSYRSLAAAGKKLESSEMLHKFYRRRSFHEIELIMSNKKYEFQQEIRRICESLAEKFPHIVVTADLWAAHEAVKSKVCNRKAEHKREVRKREGQSTGSAEMNARMRQMQEMAAKKAQHLVEARRRKAQSRKAARRSEAGGVRHNNKTANAPSSADLTNSRPLSPQLRSREGVEESRLSVPSQVQSSEKSEFSEEATTPLFDLREDPNVLSVTRDKKIAPNETVSRDTAQSIHTENDGDRHERSTTGGVPASKKRIGKRESNSNDAINIVLDDTSMPSKKHKKFQAPKKNASAKRKCTETNVSLTVDDSPARKRRNRMVPKRYRN
ncbi:hypothetical protein FGB62_253g00 [Gracilaria domingensis]|nr:hypothetical protein FGB62_253g00 [Gracilaria domingensis]